MQTKTFTVVFYKADSLVKGPGQNKGVVLIEAYDRNDASYRFKQEYAGQFSTIDKIEEL